MSNSRYYYGEIVARLASRIFTTKDLKPKLNLSENESNEDAICGLCADAGRVFDTLEDLSGEHFIDWPKALNHYSDSLCNFLIEGRLPCTTDMISMAAKSMNRSRAECLGKVKEAL